MVKKVEITAWNIAKNSRTKLREGEIEVNSGRGRSLKLWSSTFITNNRTIISSLRQELRYQGIGVDIEQNSKLNTCIQEIRDYSDIKKA